MDEARARKLAQRAIDELGGNVALEHLYREEHTPDPEQEFIIEDERVVVRLRCADRPATVNVGPYTFELRSGELARV